jgi:hypothetical protein
MASSQSYRLRLLARRDGVFVPLWHRVRATDEDVSTMYRGLLDSCRLPRHEGRAFISIGIGWERGAAEAWRVLDRLGHLELPELDARWRLTEVGERRGARVGGGAQVGGGIQPAIREDRH